MAAPVWTLSVDLQTKTASFTTGMAEAARSARSTFTQIRSDAKEGGEETSKSFVNAQQALGVLTNSLRGDAENALADIIRELSHTGVVMAALPFAAVGGGLLLAINLAVEAAAKLREWREEQEKITAEQTRFGTALRESFNGLDEKILQAEEHADELTNNHLGALKKQLELIDHQSMSELIQQIESIAKAAEPVFKALEGHWYTMGIGSAGASHALEQFKTTYEALQAQGKDKEAGDLLAGTLASAEKVLAAQRAMNSSRGDMGALGRTVDYSAQYHAQAVLQAAKVGSTEKEVQAQEALVRALSSQVTAEQKIAELKSLDKGNAAKQTGNEDSARRAEAAKAAAASELAINELRLQADKAMAAATLEIQRASIADRLTSDLAFAEREKEIKLASNQQEMAALDRSGKDYANQLKGLQEKALEISQQHETSVAELRSRSTIEQNKKDLADYEQGERDKLGATQQGSQARLDVLEASIQDAQARSLQDTDYYRQLGSQRIDLIRQLAQDEAKLKADAAREEADNTQKMGQQALAAELEQQTLRDSSRRMTDAQRVSELTESSNRELAIKQAALQQEQVALDTSAKDYENKLQALQNKERQLVQAHVNDIASIKAQSEMAQNARTEISYQRFAAIAAGGLTSVIMGHQTFAAMMSSIGDQVASGMLQNALKDAMTADFGKEKDAAKAARKMFLAGMELPFPANIVAAPTLAAGAFAAVMAFAGGTDGVPGVGRGDVVPAMLTPGEGVVPGGVMDGLRNVARNGGFDRGPSVNIRAHFAPTVHALDAAGVDKVLTKHGEVFQKHINNAVRKANR